MKGVVIVKIKEYKTAHKKVEDLKSLYIHSIIFSLVNIMLAVINVKTHKQSKKWWFFIL